MDTRTLAFARSFMLPYLCHPKLESFAKLAARVTSQLFFLLIKPI